MSTRSKFCWFTLSLVLCISASAHAQETAAQGGGTNVNEMKFVTIPGLPTCAHGSVQSGNPGSGPSFILARTTAGCVIPWHWHTANEHLIMVSGVARLDMKDGKPLTLRAGGFGLMPAHHVHQFRCLSSACQLYIYSDVAFDIHYVNREGAEITPADAMKAVKEKAATEMK